MAKVHVSFTLDSEKDKRLVRWLDDLPQGRRSEAIRNALADHLDDSVTLGDVYEAIQDLKRHGVVMAPGDESQLLDVPADVLENLNKLGL